MAIGARFCVLPGRREHIADFVDRDRAAERLALRLEPVAHLAVEIGQRQPADAAFRSRADPRCLHQRVPQTLGVDLQVLQRQTSAWRQHNPWNWCLNQASLARDGHGWQGAE